MGNDLEVCSKDSHIEEFFDQELGPEKETPWEFFNRSHDRFLNRLVQPQRFSYQTSDLHPGRYCSPIYSLPSHLIWEHTEFNIFSQGLTLHCCHWKVKLKQPKDPLIGLKPICIIYLHTNMRSIVDTLEVLPVAAALECSVIAMDLPGCGQSAGTLTGTMDKDIETLIDWAKCLEGDNVRIVLWARGLATSPAMSYCAALCTALLPPLPAPTSTKKSTLSLFKSSNPKETETLDRGDKTLLHQIVREQLSVKCLVLDSPFTGVKEMIVAGLERMHGKGFTFTKSIVQWGVKRILSSLSKRLDGLDLTSIRPLSLIPSLTPLPALVFSPLDDDYIPPAMGQTIGQRWREAGGQVECREIQGKHFTPRGAGEVGESVNFIRNCLNGVEIEGKRGGEGEGKRRLKGEGESERTGEGRDRGESASSLPSDFSPYGDDLPPPPEAFQEGGEGVLHYIDLEREEYEEERAGEGVTLLPPFSPESLFALTSPLSTAPLGGVKSSRSLSSLALKGMG